MSDEELLKNFRNDGNNKWLGILLPRYSLLLFGVCMKYLKNEEDARDSVQQIFVKVIDELKKYEVTYFKSWIYMVAKNYCLMQIRNHKNVPAEWNDNIQIAEDADDRESRKNKERLLNELHENLSKLKPGQRQCLDYFYLQKKSYAEISQLTGYSISQVKSYLQNGKRNLELLMHENNK
ncbi:MAG: sigma-70 family RNA polymerase sigma factor [Chitinophagaceae bacterium]|nr:sigma-70 family RNA polymerase sigma factor [Chitinophagaceae bacterium]